MSGRALSRQCSGPASTSGRVPVESRQPCRSIANSRRLLGSARHLKAGSIAPCRQHDSRLCWRLAASFVSAAEEDVGTRRRGRPKKVDAEAQAADEADAEDPLDALPKPAEYQQTLQRSFTLSGIGLHTGEYAAVRVRPAFAGEGRYFVRVPDGTISSSGAPPDDQQAVPNPLLDKAKLEFFDVFMAAQELAGFKGTFLDFLELQTQDGVQGAAEVLQAVGEEASRGQWLEDEPEPILARGEDEEALSAALDSIPEHGVVPDGVSVCQVLGGGNVTGEGESDDDLMVIGSEVLLATLEACGVDNARIEMEGGLELPVLDGSAIGWVKEIEFVGLRAAPLSETDAANVARQELESGEAVEVADGQYETILPFARRLALRPTEAVIVRDGDAFVSLVPEDAIRLTVGIDHTQTAAVIGKQWATWCMHEDAHFRFELGDARQYAESRRAVEALRDMGLLQGATDSCMLIAEGDSWEDNQMVRHIKDEPARHALVDLIGDLSLNSVNGSCGLPIGHIVAYKPNHALNMKFLRALREATSEEHWVPMIESADGPADGADNVGEGDPEAEFEEPTGEDSDEGEEGEAELQQ